MRAVEAAIEKGAKCIWGPVFESSIMLDEDRRKLAPVYFGKGYDVPENGRAR